MDTTHSVLRGRLQERRFIGGGLTAGSRGLVEWIELRGQEGVSEP